MFHFLKKNFTRSGNIEKDIVKKYFDKTQSLMFDKKAASIEQDHISDFTKDYQCRTILDLGCGEGRYSHCFKNYEYYHGVDFSESFISNTESSERRKFSCSDVVDFYEDKIYDTVLLIGLITYLEDEDIKKMVNNIKGMMSSNSVVILRSVTLKDTGLKKIYYDSKKGLINRLRFLKPRYQIIRRTKDYELELFSSLRLLKMKEIPGTSYTLYSFAK